MIDLYNFLTALIIALIFFGMFYGIIRAGQAYSKNQGKPRSEQKGMGCTWLLFLFFLLFLPTWGVGLWLRPIGPTVAGVRILNYLFVALIFTILIAAINSATGERADEDTPGIKLFKTLLWVFLGLMVLAIIGGLLL